MGICKELLPPLFKEHKRRPFCGSIMTLGVMDVNLTFEELSLAFNKEGIRVRDDIGIGFSKKAHYLKRGCIDDATFYSAFGFGDIKRMDYSLFEGADIEFDLNSENIPEGLVNKFDVVMDSGTIEHVFNIPVALKSVFRMLKVGGRVIHFSPSNNYMNHAYYMLSPILFSEYYGENKFEINDIQLLKHSCGEVGKPEIFVDLNKKSDREFKREDNGYVALTCLIATKTKESTYHIVPKQGCYSKGLWNK